MEIEYKKDGNQSYMIIPNATIDENDYQIQMVLHNKIEELLPVRINYINNHKELYYDTTSKVALQAGFARRKIGKKELIRLMDTIRKMNEAMKEYLLDVNQILFDPECIFVDLKEEKYYFGYCPTLETDLQVNMRMLFDFLLANVNHEDKVATEIIYGMMQITISDSYTIQDLQDLVESVNEKEKRKAEPQHRAKEENIFEIDEPKKNFWEWLKGLFRKTEYQDEEELKSPTEVDVTKEELIQADFEDATVFLASSGTIYSIKLSSKNLETPIVIQPNIFPCIFGKSRKSSDYIIDSPVISRVHMKLSADEQGFYIEDLNSTNGTFLNEMKLLPHQPMKVESGDLIAMANIEFLVE
ncbi:MAG: FHA domain-containing protein [Eubacterium sp.]|nr:FHA domain-containing protein [Eubacterium sp.]